jgi:hypothetical protein
MGLCFFNNERIIAVMVIKVEFGNENNIPLKSHVLRGILKSQIPTVTEQFFQTSAYRWGRMYSIVGKDKTLIRQF